MHKYRLVAKKGEGTFSEVLKAQCIKNGKYVAIKCMKNHFDSLDQVNNLREIQALRRLSPHANIVKLLEVLYDQPTGRLALVFELMDMNIYELIRGRRHYVAEDRVKNYMYQLMKAMDHMHRNGIFHRDIKPENILIMDDCLKLADFGSCRGIYSKQPYTEYISTRWYRAPECLLTDGYYNYKMDMWGVGCVFFEIVSLFPLFPGTNELDQIQKIHNILGTPPADLLAKMKKRSQHMDFNFPPKEGSGILKLIPHVAPDCSDLVAKLLAYNPDERLSARQALRHPYFRELREAEKRHKAMLTPDAAASGSFAHLEPDKPHRQQAVSSNGSEHDTTTSPPESARNNGSEMTGTLGLPSINNKAANPHSGSLGAPLPGSYAAHHILTHGATTGGGTASDGAGDHAEGNDSGSYRLPGLHAQHSSVSIGEDSDVLPPITNAGGGAKGGNAGGMGGGGAVGTGTARRSTMAHYDTGAYPSKGKGGAAGGAAANAGGGGGGMGGMGAAAGAGGVAGMGVRRQSIGPNQIQMQGQGKYSSKAGGVGPTGNGGGGMAAGGAQVGGGGGGADGGGARASGYGPAGAPPMLKEPSQSFGKFKANSMSSNTAASNKQQGNGGKYISPYSLRQMAGNA